MKVLKNNQHGNSEIFEGSNKEVLNKLRQEAKTLRREARLRNNLPDNVHSIDENLHQSELVTMASFEINDKGLNQLLELISNHGVCDYILDK